MPIGALMDSLLLAAWGVVAAAFIAWIVSEWRHTRRPRHGRRGNRAV